MTVPVGTKVAATTWSGSLTVRGVHGDIEARSQSGDVQVRDAGDRLDIESLGRIDRPESLSLNDIGLVTIRTHEPLFVDPYKVSRDTGSFILIDAATRSTVAAGMIRDVLDDPTSEDWSI